jgi:hypothetical protein
MVERFTVLDGELTVKRDGQTSILREGETGVVEPGGWHNGGTPPTGRGASRGPDRFRSKATRAERLRPRPTKPDSEPSSQESGQSDPGARATLGYDHLLEPSVSGPASC